MVNHCMAIVLEHNFMMFPKGLKNFKNWLSIQYSNDLQVYIALVLALSGLSYQKTMQEILHLPPTYWSALKQVQGHTAPLFFNLCSLHINITFNAIVCVCVCGGGQTLKTCS